MARQSILSGKRNIGALYFEPKPISFGWEAETTLVNTLNPWSQLYGQEIRLLSALFVFGFIRLQILRDDIRASIASISGIFLSHLLKGIHSFSEFCSLSWRVARFIPRLASLSTHPLLGSITVAYLGMCERKHTIPKSLKHYLDSLEVKWPDYLLAPWFVCGIIDPAPTRNKFLVTLSEAEWMNIESEIVSFLWPGPWPVTKMY